MVFINTNIQTFHANQYSTTVNKLDFYVPYVSILGTNNFEKNKTQIF